MTENYYVPDYDKIDGHFYEFIQQNAKIDQNDELAFCYLDIDQSKQISKEVFDFIQTETTVFERAEFWNFLNLDKMCCSCPTLLEFLRTNKLRPVVSVCIQVHKEKSNNVIHMDGGNEFVKKNPRILFPISNCDNSVTKFYKLKIENLDQNSIDSIDTDYFFVNGEDAEFTQSCTLNKPVLFNPRYPHAVCMDNSSPSPRLSLTFFFMNVPVFFNLDRAKNVLNQVKTLNNLNTSVINDLQENINELSNRLKINTLNTSIVEQAYQKEALELTNPVFLNKDTIEYIRVNKLSPLSFLEEF